MNPPVQESKSDHEHHTVQHQTLINVIQNVVAHLMPHGGFDFGKSAALQQVVVQRNPHRLSQAADIGADAVRLPGGVELIDVGRRNAVGARHAENGTFDVRVLQNLVVIE